jgi:hypothetical protein
MVEEWDVISNGQEHVSKETILSFTIQAIESALPEDMEPAPSRSRSQVSRTLAQHLLQSPRWIDLKHIQRYTFTEYVEFALRPLLHDLKMEHHPSTLFYAPPSSRHASYLEGELASTPLTLLFLDVDGVLNCSGVKAASDGARSDCMSTQHGERTEFRSASAGFRSASAVPAPANHPSTHFPLYLPQLGQLRRIHEETQCYVVLSTSWREHVDMKVTLLLILRELGITIIGQTPILGPSKTRADEINTFLENALQCCDVPHWVVLDDMDLVHQCVKKKFLYHSSTRLCRSREVFADHFVKCDMKHGLTQREADIAIQILRGVAPRERVGESTSSVGLSSFVEED